MCNHYPPSGRLHACVRVHHKLTLCDLPQASHCAVQPFIMDCTNRHLKSDKWSLCGHFLPEASISEEFGCLATIRVAVCSEYGFCKPVVY